MEWWRELSGLNQFYYCGALFFSVFFLWQLLATFAGGGGDHGDMPAAGGMDDGSGLDAAGHDATYADFEHGAESDAVQSVAAFKVLSLRSLITFFTLFFWANAFYTQNGVSVGTAIGLSTLWGAAGMAFVAIAFYYLIRLSVDGTARLASCIGREGSVYQPIPVNGFGRVRATVGNTVSHIRACSQSGEPIAAGVRVKIVRQVDLNVVEVKPLVETSAKEEGTAAS